MLKAFKTFHSCKKATQQKQFLLKRSSTKSEAGFTMIEMIVVVIILSVLSAIAAPSWLAFLNRQRISTANNAVLRALQTAQSEAKRTKKNYSVSFQNETTTNIPQVAIYPDTTTLTSSATNFKQLVEGQSVGKIRFDSSSSTKVSFDYLGTVKQTTPLKVIVYSPDTTNVKRCVVVETILGAMRIAENTACN